jgi:outer membrane biosynthesis protein TonB
MIRRMRSPLHRYRSPFSALLLLAAIAAAYSAPVAQTPAKKPLTVDDYTKWRTIADSAISGDGKWVTYTLQQTNTIPAEAKPVLHLKHLETNEEITVPHANGGTFSLDSRWIAYQVDPGAAERARRERAGGGGGGGGGGTPPQPPAPPAPDPANPPSTPPTTPPPTQPVTPPVTNPPATPPTNPPPPPTTPPGQPPAQPPVSPTPPAQPPTQPQPSATTPAAPQGAGGRGSSTIPPRRVELRNLATGTVQSWQDIGSFTFSPTSTHLFLRRRAPEAAGGGGGRGGGAPAAPGGPAGGGQGAQSGPRGLDVLLVDLRTGKHQLLGSVADIAWNRTGDLLA